MLGHKINTQIQPMYLSKAHKKLIISQFINNPTVKLNILSMTISRMIHADERTIYEYLESVTVDNIFGRVLKKDVIKELDSQSNGSANRGETGTANSKMQNERGAANDVSAVQGRGPLRTRKQVRSVETRATTHARMHSSGKSDAARSSFTRSSSSLHVINQSFNRMQPKTGFNDADGKTQSEICMNTDDYAGLYSGKLVEYTQDDIRPNLSMKQDSQDVSKQINLLECKQLHITDISDSLIKDFLAVYNFLSIFYDDLEIGDCEEIQKSLRGDNKKTVLRGKRGRKKNIKRMKVSDRLDNDEQPGEQDANERTHICGDLTMDQLVHLIKNNFVDLSLILLRLVAQDRKTEKLVNFKEKVARTISTFYSDVEEKPIQNVKRIQWFSKPLTHKNVIAGINSLFIDIKRVMDLKNVVALNVKEFDSKLKVLKFLVDVLLEGNIIRGIVGQDRNRKWEKEKMMIRTEIKQLKGEIKLKKTSFNGSISNISAVNNGKSNDETSQTVMCDITEELEKITEQISQLNTKFSEIEIKCFKSRLNPEVGEYDDLIFVYMDRRVIFERDNIVYYLTKHEIIQLMDRVDDEMRLNLRLALACVQDE